MGKDQGRESARRLIMMGVHVIGTAVQDEGDSFAPRSSAKTFVFDPTASESQHLDYSEGGSHPFSQVFDTRKLDQKELILEVFPTLP